MTRVLWSSIGSRPSSLARLTSGLGRHVAGTWDVADRVLKGGPRVQYRGAALGENTAHLLSGHFWRALVGFANYSLLNGLGLLRLRP
jgi:hypothetical protein